MAAVIELTTGQQGYHEVLRRVLTQGRKRAPRGLSTLDLGHTTVVVYNPHRSLPLGCGRKISTKVAAVEALQLIAMEMREDLVLKASPRFADYLDEDRFHGAYGRRLGGSNQLAHVEEKLRRDPDTRQAVAVVWDPILDNIAGKHDYPCTITMGFAIQNDHLEMYTTMRSNDAFLGLPYDIFNFTQLQLTMARMLDVAPGRYYHTAWSLHVYESDIPAIEQVTPPALERLGTFQPQGVGCPGENGDLVRAAANVLLDGDRPPHRELTVSEEWFHAQITSLLG